MSRSLRAWTRSCALVSAAVRGGGRLDTREVQRNLCYERLVRTVSSLTPLTWVAALMVALTFGPVALGKVGSPHSRPSVGLVGRGSSKPHAATHRVSRSSDRPHVPRLSAQGRTGRPELLALGSGYSSRHGSGQVRALQRRLASLGYAPGPIDGRYGPLTERAVIRFQATHGLQVDGIAGSRTLTAVASAMPVLYPGDGYVPGGSPLVRGLQRNLAAAGYALGPIDGRYGPLTERAVRRFQTARHLQPDGIAGQQTLDRLQTVVRRQLHQGPRPVPSRPSTRRDGRPAHTRPSGGRSRTKPAPAQPTRHRAGRPAGSLSLVWIIGLVCLLLAVLAGARWRWRRARDGRLPGAPAEAGGNGWNGTARGRTGPPEVPEIALGLSAAPDDPLTGEADDGAEDQLKGSAAFRLGLLLAQEGDRVGAEDAFRRADERGHPGGAFEIGGLLVQEADRAGAKEAFQRADERGHPGAAFHLGVFLVHEGDLAAAKEAFRRADQRGHPSAAFDLGALLLQEGDSAGAEEAFRRADQHGDPGAACNLGVLLENRGDLVGAKAAYRRADERGNRVGACNLGALLEQQGDLAGAKAAYRRADARGDSAGAYLLGVLLEREGDHAGAKAAYRRADRRGHPEGACNLGLLLKQEGDRPAALIAFRRAGERGSPEVVEVARAALLELDLDEESER